MLVDHPSRGSAVAPGPIGASPLEDRSASARPRRNPSIQSRSLSAARTSSRTDSISALLDPTDPVGFRSQCWPSRQERAHERFDAIEVFRFGDNLHSINRRVRHGHSLPDRAREPIGRSVRGSHLADDSQVERGGAMFSIERCDLVLPRLSTRIEVGRLCVQPIRATWGHCRQAAQGRLVEA